VLAIAGDSEWVSIRARKETTIPAERWSSLQPQSATPLAPAAASAPTTPAQSQTAAWAAEAEQWSRQTTWTSSRPGAARLFIFVQTPNITKYPEFARGLSLLDEKSSLLVRLADTAVHVDPTAGWMAFTTDLAAGFYILARDGPASFATTYRCICATRGRRSCFSPGAPALRSVRSRRIWLRAVMDSGATMKWRPRRMRCSPRSAVKRTLRRS
jgi:hypothetical protein